MASLIVSHYLPFATEMLMCSCVKLTVCYFLQDPATKDEDHEGIITLNVIDDLKGGDQVYVEWERYQGIRLGDSGEKNIIFTGEKICDS